MRDDKVFGAVVSEPESIDKGLDTKAEQLLLMYLGGSYTPREFWEEGIMLQNPPINATWVLGFKGQVFLASVSEVQHSTGFWELSSGSYMLRYENLLWDLYRTFCNFILFLKYSYGRNNLHHLRTSFDMRAQDMIGGPVDKDAIAEKIFDGMSENDPASGSKSFLKCDKICLCLTSYSFVSRKGIL